jgi:ABC-type glycerol-3-phosphate transport system substrate-binding protein
MKKTGLCLVLLVSGAMVLFAGGGGQKSGATGSTGAASGSYKPLASSVTGEITIMMWSGDGAFLQDIGHKNYAPTELLGQNQAAAYAVAKEFNKIYPNVKINIYAKSGDPNSDGISWAQHRENFAMEFGVPPDLYAATDLPSDVQKGMVADISVFADDPVYKSFNPSIMSMMALGGKQFGLPQYILPWGVFVNRSLANANNIDIPDPKWSIDDYTMFTAHSRADTYYGAMDAPLDFLRTGTKDFAYSLLHRDNNGSYVNLNSAAIRDLLKYIPQWAQHSVNPQNDLGKVSPEFMQASDWWSYNFFKNGKLLTLTGDPWMMGDAANPTPGHWGTAQFSDWDIYPRPSTAYVGNHIGVVLDPFAIRNYAMDDGNATLSAAEKAKLQLTYEFAKFWCGDTRSWQARADQMFNDQGVLKTSMNDSFPHVTGAEFEKQMAVWYKTSTHQRFADKSKMPGFQYVLELWQTGQFWDVTDKSYPWTYEFEGSSRVIVYEWENCWNVDVTGATRTDANWLDQMYAKLPDWNTQFNQRWAAKFVAVQNGLATYYK